MRLRLTMVLVLMLIIAVFSVTLAEHSVPTIDISATTIEFCSNTNTVKAFGNLIIRYEEYEFTADELEYIQDEGKAHFQGNVVVTYGDESSICADEIILYTFDEKFVASSKDRVFIKTSEIEAYAKEIEYEVTTRKALMKGQVSVKAGDISAKCGRLEALEDVLVLSDQAIVIQNGRRFSGDEIVVYIDEKRIIARGNSRMLID